MEESVGVDMREWYGLVVNGELIAVQLFSSEPTIFDFRMGYSSRNEYEIVAVNPVITKIYDPLM